MDIRGLDLDSVGETDAWYRALSAAESADLVAPVVLGSEAVLTSLRSNDTNPSSDRRAFGAWRGAECVGAAVLGLPRHGNTHLAEIELGVPPGARQRGVGRAMLGHLREVARQEGRTVLAATVDVAGAGRPLAASPGGRFALACGFTPRHTEFRFLLELPVADEKLKALEEAAARRAGEYRVAGWTGVPPRDVIEQLARLHTMMDVDVPAGELSREPTTWDADRVLRTLERRIEQGHRPITTLISRPGAESAGYTTMLAMSGESRAVIQDNTFVLRSCRGRGLGMLAKIANLRLLAAEAPRARHVHTWTAEVNGAMHSVNERLGFRPVETMYEVEAAV
jgi:GNAT superfamily N-acetyltransferase